MLRLGWFSTGRGEGSRGFLELVYQEIVTKKLDASFEFVFTNREYGEADGSDRYQHLVKQYDVPLLALSSKRYQEEHGGSPWAQHRKGFHKQAMELIAKYDPDICVLAGYMLITSPEMCRKYPMINLHPALPWGPQGTWQQVIWELIEQQASETGVMVHIATEQLDSGPVLAYTSFSIRGHGFDKLWKEVQGKSQEELRAFGEEQPLFKRIRAEGLRRERPLLLTVLRALSDRTFRIAGGNVFDRDKETITEAINMNNEVGRYLAGKP